MTKRLIESATLRQSAGKLDQKSVVEEKKKNKKNKTTKKKKKTRKGEKKKKKPKIFKYSSDAVDRGLKAARSKFYDMSKS